MNNKKVALLFCLLGWSMTSLISCKENTILPPDLVPAVDGINTFQTDTFTVVSRTVNQDSVLTGGTFGGTDKSAEFDFYHGIGMISTANNDVFGNTIGSSYFQVVQPVPNFTFKGTNQQIDSIVLSVRYIAAYGDTNSAPQQSFSLYRTKDNLTKDSAYYENSPVNYTASDKISNDIMVDFNTISTDSPLVGTNKLNPQLRFNIDASFGDSLLNQTTSGAYLNYTTFLEWMGGLYIAPDSTVGGSTLGYFDTYNAQFVVYYRNTDANSNIDTAEARFRFDPTYCSRFNRITRNYDAGAVKAKPYIESTNPLGDSLVFIQGEPGLAAEISFPYVDQFPNAIINKAELFFTVIRPFGSDTINYNIPERLQILYVDENGEDQILQDYIQLGPTWVGGFRKFYNISGGDILQYRMNLSHTIQNAVTQQNKNFKLKISGVRTNYSALHQTIVGGATRANPLEKMKLNIIFTKIQ